MNIYVAFLRGINVGGHKLIKMADLVRIFTKAGCRDVRTYIQSGNVIFASPLTDVDYLTRKLETALNKAVGYQVPMILKTLPEEMASPLLSRAGKRTANADFPMDLSRSNSDYWQLRGTGAH